MAETHTFIMILQTFFGVYAYDQLVIPKATVAELSSTYGSYAASNAVDGITKQHISYCSHTDDRYGIKEAWLRIDLNKNYSIKKVKFWYRSDQPRTTRLPGYSIRVSNDSALPSPESICYQDPEHAIQKIEIENNCEMTGQFVWIYQNHTYLGKCPILEICEVKVFGCDTGKYGEFCNHTCDHCKNNDTCGIASGRCDHSGCAKANFLPPLCTECVPGRFGVDCHNTCSLFCSNKTCNRTTGACLHGCNTGYTGRFCNQCRVLLERTERTAIKNVGVHGCEEGYTGIRCHTPCQDGKYGRNCKNNCTGNCFNNQICDRKDGSCSTCAIGFEGKTCDKQCEPGQYGINCSLECGHCLHSSACNTTTGVCKIGCDPGWQDSDRCDTACINGTYGMDCRYNCTQTCINGESCDKRDGSCTTTTVEKQTHFGVIAGSLSSIVALTLFLIAATLVVLRQRKKNPFSEKLIVEMDENLKDNIWTGSRKISDLFQMIQRLENGKDVSFENEFKSIPYGELSGVSCTVGKLPENLPKNRFKTTFPYDHSRIVLQSSQTADYINANYIKDTWRRRVYIASQGPKQNTVNDFVQMVWQEDVAVIVMVTNCKEGDTVKCESYWPKTEMKKIVKGVYIIQMLSQKEYSNFMIRELKMTSKELNTSREIVQLQYTTWPDHGIPTPLDLLVYYQYVSRAMEKHPGHKLLVHCSAGIGRTGTFIALDALYRQGMQEGKINVEDYVNTMREDRMNMVQNTSQYRFLYHVLYEAFRSQGTVLSKDSFANEVENEMSPIQAVNMSRFRKDFMELSSIKPVFTEDETKFGVLNLHLNMTKSVLPADNMRIILSSYVPGRGSYYNAVPLSTFTKRDCFIAAQYPVPGAGVDLIRLLVDQECSTMVSVNPLSEVPSSNEWFPISTDCNSVCPYAIQIEPTDRLSEPFCKYVLTMRATTNNDWHKVHVYEMTTWGTEDVLPSHTNALLDVVKAVQRDEKVDPEHKIAIASRDGATGCGVFCALYNAIQQLQQDEEVDMFTIVRQLQSRRPEIISDLKEYLFVCQAVAEYINSSPEGIRTVPDVGSCKADDNIYANT